MRFSAVALAIAAAVALGSPAVRAGQVTVHLKNGASVRGELLAERRDRIIVDLGFTVLDIPTKRILRQESAGTAEPAEARWQDLYHENPGREPLSVQDNVARVENAVVLVKTPTGLGSGFLIHREGFVLTNHHVIAGERKITVTLFVRDDGKGLSRRELDVTRVVAVDPHGDLALVKIDGDPGRPFATVPLGTTADLTSGETVFAIGSPLGLDRTISEGIVSVRNRLLDGHVFLQTTVQMNPGNSGGPLFNLRGEVIGMSSRKVHAVGVEGLAFAIPVDRVKSFLANRDAFAFDERNPNNGFRYNEPPRPPRDR